MTRRLADGVLVRLRDGVVRGVDGKLLLGGSPVRAVRLSDRAHSMIRDGTIVVDSASEPLAARLLDANLADPVLDGVPSDHRNLTVVVPVRDRAAQLSRCLAALAGLDVVVVDDQSYNSADVAAVAAQHRARLVTLARNVGPAGARNAGLITITTPFVAFVDSDVNVEPQALLALTRHLLVDANVAVVGPMVKGRPLGPKPRWFERYDAAASSLDLGARPCSVGRGAAVGWLPSACLVARVDALGSGFDASMRVGEDVDLVWRLTDQGRSVRYDPSVVALHDVRPTMRGWLGRKALYGTGGADLAQRHGDRGAPAVLSPGNGIAAAALLLRSPMAPVVLALVTAANFRALRSHLPNMPHRNTTALGLALRGQWWAVRQESSLILRHWWPLAALVATRSRAMRTAAGTAAVVDTVTFLRERPGVGPATGFVGRRLDDAAYGAGLWAGAVRRRSAKCLVIRRPTRVGLLDRRPTISSASNDGGE